MAKLFKSVKPIIPRHSAFNLGFESNLTTEFGRITPILVQECVPGDRFRISTQILMRMAPLFAPTMSRVSAHIRYFFFPDRLGNCDFETFISGGDDGNGTILTRDNVERIASMITIGVDDACNLLRSYFIAQGYTTDNAQKEVYKLFKSSSLFDYLGFPSPDTDEQQGYNSAWYTSTMRIDLRPFIAVASIYNEYYRDENLQDAIDIVNDTQGGDLFSYLLTFMSRDKAGKIVYDLFCVRTAAFEKDYFTSALPSPQRGEETTIGENDTRVYGDGRTAVESGYVDNQKIASGLSIGGSIVASVNEFRRAIAIQRFREASARFGARYFEYIRGFFNTKVSDARLQRPEFLGSSRIPITFGEVLQTSETNLTPQGSYAGRGLGGGATAPIKYKVKEFGWIIGILTIVPKPYYFQGWPRKYQRSNKFDFYNPLFANLGEQEIKQSELIYCYPDAMGDDSLDSSRVNVLNNKLFGYTPRYSEMRYNSNEVHGDFRTNLRDWHTARLLNPDLRENDSMLTSQFIKVDNEAANRIFNYRGTDYDHFWITLYNDIRAIRPMPRFATPSI